MATDKRDILRRKWQRLHAPTLADTRQILKWLTEQLDRLGDRYNVLVESGPRVVETPPDPIYRGMIVYTDGVGWNPGLGAGFYGWDGAAWVLLGTERVFTPMPPDGQMTFTGYAPTVVIT